jgi:hypothetical protein
MLWRSRFAFSSCSFSPSRRFPQVGDRLALPFQHFHPAIALRGLGPVFRFGQ